MPTLTLETIRQNPWTVISHELPADASEFLLEVARRAAAYCRDSEYLFMTAAREGGYTPAGWDADGDAPDVHEASENRCYWADRKLCAICDQLGVSIDESTG
jgi:hypothetical protein